MKHAKYKLHPVMGSKYLFWDHGLNIFANFNEVKIKTCIFKISNLESWLHNEAFLIQSNFSMTNFTFD